MIELFTHPVTKTALLGSLAMAISSAIIGNIMFLRHKALIGETLSHAAFPGILTGVVFSELLFKGVIDSAFLGMTFGGFLFAFLGIKLVDWMENKWRVTSDAALTFTLASFMGWGVLLASFLQTSYPVGYRQALLYLYGQAASMTHLQAYLYGIVTLCLLVFIISFYPYVKALLFDLGYIQIAGIRYKWLKTFIFLFIIVTIILGVRSVGVLLMAGMLISPAVAARPWSCRFSSMLVISSIFAVASAFIGILLSFKLSSPSLSFPTGPMILLSSSAFSFISLLIAPRKGLMSKLIKNRFFRFKIQIENSLKMLWKKPDTKNKLPFWIKAALKSRGWIDKNGHLSKQGHQQAEKIVRLHRLWEVYLVQYLGQSADKVHKTAEDLEHYFSPALERELSSLLNDPLEDPHKQPIPPRGVDL